MRLRIVFTCLLASCTDDDKQENAGVITAANLSQIRLGGSVVDASVGDYYVRNEHIIAVVQKPGRQFGGGPFGGNLIDFGNTREREDVLAEAIPVFHLGLTANFYDVYVESPGGPGEDAVLVATGFDDLWDYINVESFAPEFLRYADDPGDVPGLFQFDPTADEPYLIRAEYRLPPGAHTLSVRYTVTNLSFEEVHLRAAFALDMRGAVEPFQTGRGYADFDSDIRDIQQLLQQGTDAPYFAFQGHGFSVGLKSVDFVGEASLPRLSTGIIGIAVVVLGEENLATMVDGEAGASLGPGAEKTFGFDLFSGLDVASVHAWALGDQSFGTIEGNVHVAEGPVIAGARVSVFDADRHVVTSMVSDSSGRFSAAVAPGDYVVAADDPGYPADPGHEVSVSAGQSTSLDIALAPPGTVSVQVRVAADPAAADESAGPCRLMLIGQAPGRLVPGCGPGDECADYRPFRHSKTHELAEPYPYIRYMRHCDSAQAPDAPLSVVPGSYLAVVTRGPEFTTVREYVEVAPGATVTVTGVLRRAVERGGIYAGEFHVHQMRSPDSVVPLDARVLSMAGSGVDFFATTDHDTITDLRPEIAAFGLGNELAMVPGNEVSPHDIGHFNGYPIYPLPDVQYGGPPDWGGGRNRPSPGQLFERMRARGAEVVQVNHPRGGTGYFRYLNVAYDFEHGTVSTRTTPELHDILLMDPAQPLFSVDFDVLEIYNGHSHGTAEKVMRDWFNLLSMGHRITGMGVSDTHSLYRKSPGEPRTYIRSDNGLDSKTLLANLKAGQACISTGPLLFVTARAPGKQAVVGETLTTSGDVTVDIEGRTPAWYGLSHAEVYVTSIFHEPGRDDDEEGYEPLLPEKDVALSTQTKTLANDAETKVHTASISIDSAALDRFGRDAWIVVRVRGEGSLFPVVLSNGGVAFDSHAPALSDRIKLSGGAEPFAVSNPIFIDRDGNGVYDAPFSAAR